MVMCACAATEVTKWSRCATLSLIQHYAALRSASSADLTVPATRRSTLGDRTFAVAGPRAWNTLPEAIRRCSSPDTFKRSLKTHLYIQCYF